MDSEERNIGVRISQGEQGGKRPIVKRMRTQSGFALKIRDALLSPTGVRIL